MMEFVVVTSRLISCWTLMEDASDSGPRHCSFQHGKLGVQRAHSLRLYYGIVVFELGFSHPLT
ncbi:hypothetical protein DsansV1_C01g0006821 [Dioscorea sansibarensis]